MPENGRAMQARDIMTTEIVAVTPATPLNEVARVLLDHGISAVPVVDASGGVVGMVSEGDLIGRDDAEREARRDWWLALMAEGTELNPDILANSRSAERSARDIMSAPVVTVTEATEAREIARLLATYHIKRVPVLRDRKIVGIVSRADLLRAFTEEEEVQPAALRHRSPVTALIGGALAKLDERFLHGSGDKPEAEAGADEPDIGLTVDDFKGLVSDFEQHEAERRTAARRAFAERRRRSVKTLIDQHIADESWKALLHTAREAAERGEREFMLLRFPSDLCSDGGRAINAPLPDWPRTLRGEAAEIYLRWERDLKPRGFHLKARILDFPGGKPGDVGLFLVWGE
jgi:CBS domain-containing protein